jgi:ABC-type Fe3+ transport system substrate-binding protein
MNMQAWYDYVLSKEGQIQIAKLKEAMQHLEVEEE